MMIVALRQIVNRGCPVSQRRYEDHYGRLARQKGFPARSVFKLQEMQERFHLLRRGARVLDLGASPGSWSQYCLQQIGERGRLTAVDVKELRMRVDPATEVRFIRADLFDGALEEQLRQGGPYDLVLSDAAPETSGSHLVDTQGSLELARRALHIATANLAAGGNLVVKVFQGGEEKGLLEEMKRAFGRARAYKPAASRSESREVYFLGLGLRREKRTVKPT
jgi:23S rRNA (uridine2552-2'-O)-methyltransferase